MDKIAQALIRHSEVMEEYIRIEREKLSPWCDADQAAAILGLSVTSSREHTRRLKAMIERGLITKFRDGRPIRYWKEELHRLSAKRAEGKIMY